MQITTPLGSSATCTGGAAGSVTGTSVAGDQSVTLFTTPSTPANAEYRVSYSGVICSANSTVGGNASAHNGQAASGFSDVVVVGANTLVAVPFFTSVASIAYRINYCYASYRLL